MKKILRVEEIFLVEEIALFFKDNGFSFLYLYELDTLFAVINYLLPTQETPYIEFSGININNYRAIKEFNEVFLKKFREDILKDFDKYLFNEKNFKWMILKQDMTKEDIKKLNKLKKYY